MDIAFFVKKYRNDVDWNYIVDQFGELKFEDFGNVVFTAVEQWFGVKSPIQLRSIQEEVMESFTNYTLEGGVFGKIGRDSSINYLKNNNRDSDKVSKLSTLINRMFPSADTIEKRYTYLQRKHWLLPVAWVHRLFKTRETWGEHAAQAKKIMNANDTEVLKMRQMYKELGL